MACMAAPAAVEPATAPELESRPATTAVEFKSSGVKGVEVGGVEGKPTSVACYDIRDDDTDDSPQHDRVFVASSPLRGKRVGLVPVRASPAGAHFFKKNMHGKRHHRRHLGGCRRRETRVCTEIRSNGRLLVKK